MSESRTVFVGGIGKCEHCQTLLTVEDMPAESIDVIWLCPNCEKELTGKTFGYEGQGEETEKVKWVGPEGNWQENKPNKDFDLGSWRVTIRPMASIRI